MTTQATDTRPLADMPLMDPATLKCPYHYDETLRGEAPVYQDPQTGIFIVSTYDLVREAHRKPGVFSNEFGLAANAAQRIQRQPLEQSASPKTTRPQANGKQFTANAETQVCTVRALKTYFPVAEVTDSVLPKFRYE